MTFDLSSKTTYSLRENYFNTERYDDENGVGMEHIIQGLVTQRSQKRDRHVSDDLTNHLFPGQGQNHGTDLVARYSCKKLVAIITLLDIGINKFQLSLYLFLFIF